MTTSPPSPFRPCALGSFEVHSTQGPSFTPVRFDHDFTLSLERHVSDSLGTEWVLLVHDGLHQLLSLNLCDLRRNSRVLNDAVSIEGGTYRVRIFIQSSERQIVLDFASGRDFDIFTALLQRTGFRLRLRSQSAVDSGPRLSSITPLPGQAFFGTPFQAQKESSSSPFWSDYQPNGTQVSMSPTAEAHQQGWPQPSRQTQLQDSTQLTVFQPHLNPYTAFSRSDPYRPRQGSPLQRVVSGTSEFSPPTASGDQRPCSPRPIVPSASMSLLRTASYNAASYNSFSQSQRTEQSQPSQETQVSSESTLSPLSEPEYVSVAIGNSPSRLADEAVGTQFGKLLPPSRRLPFKENPRKRSTDSSLTDDELEKLKRSRPAKRLKSELTTSGIQAKPGEDGPALAEDLPPKTARQEGPAARRAGAIVVRQKLARERASKSISHGPKANPKANPKTRIAKSPPKRPLPSNTPPKTRRVTALQQASPNHPPPAASVQSESNTSPATRKASKAHQSVVEKSPRQSRSAEPKNAWASGTRRKTTPVRKAKAIKETSETKSMGVRWQTRKAIPFSAITLQPSVSRVNTLRSAKKGPSIAPAAKYEVGPSTKQDLPIAGSEKKQTTQLAKRAKARKENLGEVGQATKQVSLTAEIKTTRVSQPAKRAKANAGLLLEVVEKPTKQISLTPASRKKRATTTRSAPKARLTPQVLTETAALTQPLSTIRMPSKQSPWSLERPVESLTDVRLRPSRASFLGRLSAGPAMFVAQSMQRSRPGPSALAPPSDLIVQNGSHALASIKCLAKQPANAVVPPPTPKSNTLAKSNSVQRPILVTEPMLKELDGILDKYLDQYEEDVQRGLDQNSLLRYYGHQRARATEFWY